MTARTVTESFHAWLIRQRRYCDRCRNKLTPATTVRNFNGKDIVLCHTHASRLDAVRESDNKQESKIP